MLPSLDLYQIIGYIEAPLVARVKAAGGGVLAEGRGVTGVSRSAGGPASRAFYIDDLD